MDLTRDALEFLAEGSVPHLVEGESKRFSDKILYEVEPKEYPDPLKLSTLSSLVAYINDPMDKILTSSTKFLLVISSPTSVSLVSELDTDNQRETLVECRAMLPTTADLFTWSQREFFTIYMASMCTKTEDRDVVQEFLSRLSVGTIAEYGDDGISQRATIKKGVTGKQDVVVPNPLTLAPYRTFTEIDQPKNSFIFRLKDQSDEVYCRLFEADGGAWKHDAITSIKDYLELHLKTDLNLRVIA